MVYISLKLDINKGSSGDPYNDLTFTFQLS